MKISPDFLQELHDKNDIISVMQGYVDLKRSGNSYMCRCPFHNEKTPSCSVSAEKGLFHCFGCGAGGDVITFVMQIENLDYIEAVRFLAQRAGMPMPEDKDDGTADKRRRMYEMNREAGKYFHKLLFSEEGRAGLEYLRRRGLSDHTIKLFGLGYAKDDFQGLRFHLRNMGFGDFEMADASLLVNNNNRFYDKFRNRVMFPIFDTRGNVAGFGGRAMDDVSKPKYLNSSETMVFSKSSLLFALNRAKLTKADYMILCEGYMDVISMHQAGFDSAVASLGTALTEQQCAILSRMGKKEVVLSYDSDEPGQKAAARAIDLLSAAGIRARILKIPDAKDPDEFIRKNGADAFYNILEKSEGAIEYQMDKLAAGLDLNSPDDVSRYLEKAVSFFAEIPNDIKRSICISRAAKLTGIAAANIESAVENQRKREQRFAHSKEQKEIMREFRRPDKINPESSKLQRESRAENGIICFLFHNPDALGDVKSSLTGGFVTEFNKRVYDFLSQLIESGSIPDISRFNEGFNPTEMGRITEIINDETFANDLDALKDFISVLNGYYLETEKPDEMSPEDLLGWVERQKAKKK